MQIETVFGGRVTRKFLDEPEIGEVGAGIWCVWIDDGPEIVACNSKAEAEDVKAALIAYRDSSREDVYDHDRILAEHKADGGSCAD
jgi:hypothetical protein